MSVGMICNREVVIVKGDTTIPEAAKIMREYHVGNVVVIEERDGLRYPVGILTDRDIIMELIAKEIDLNSVTVGDIMSSEIILARENDDLNDTIKQMRYKGIRRMPVIDERSALIGIVTLDDLIDLLVEQLKDLADLIGKERAREEHARD